jgi:very-short-patch-repair endonuclease
MPEPKKKLSEAHRQAIIRGKNTPEAKEKARLSQLGNDNKKGKKESEETRRRKSLAHTNKVLSEEHKQHLKESMNSEETQKRISEGVKRAYANPEMRERQRQGTLEAQSKPEYSQKMSESIKRVQATEEYQEKQRIAHADPAYKAKMSAYRLGVPISEEHRLKLLEGASERALARWANVSEEERRNHMQKAMDASMAILVSSLEVRVKTLLDALEVSYEQQYRIGKYFADFYVASENLIIEVNGCYWHSCPQCGYTYETKQESDAKREKYLKSKGYKILTIWEHDLRTEFVEPFLDELFSIEQDKEGR